MTTRTVPREPTQEMIAFGVTVLSVTGGNTWDDVRAMWRAMFDAAPTPQPVEAQEVAQPSIRVECPDGDNLYWIRMSHGGLQAAFPLQAPPALSISGRVLSALANYAAPQEVAQPADDLVERLRSYGEYVSVSGGPALKMRPADCVQAAARIEALIETLHTEQDRTHRYLERAERAEAELAAARDLLCNLLWRHQGFSSDVGQPIRKLFGLGPADDMTGEQLAQAKRYDAARAARKGTTP